MHIKIKKMGKKEKSNQISSLCGMPTDATLGSAYFNQEVVYRRPHGACVPVYKPLRQGSDYMGVCMGLDGRDEGKHVLFWWWSPD